MKQESYQNASEIHLLVFEVPCSFKIYINDEKLREEERDDGKMRENDNDREKNVQERTNKRTKKIFFI